MMQKPNSRNYLLFSISAVLLLGWFTTPSGIARDSQNLDINLSTLEEGEVTPTQAKFPNHTTTPTSKATNVINLPMVEQDVILQTPVPQASGEQTPPPTITPTPIPPQSIEENAPIVFGAIVIVIIITLAWFIVDRRIFKKRN